MKISRKFAALLVATATISAVLVGAQTAQADIIPNSKITISPTSGNVNTDTVFLSSIQVDVPTGVNTASSGTFVFQNGVNLGSVALARTPASTGYGETGLTGQLPMNMDRSISPTNNYVSNKLLNATTSGTVQTGDFELRMYFFAIAQSPNYVTDKFYSLPMTYDAATGAWAVKAAVVPAITTTTSLTAQATGTTVALNATVKAGSATATAAAGSIVFKDGATVVATVPVASGIASASLAGVTDGSHVYTAEFQPSDTAYAGSISGTSTVQVGGQQATSTITATVPAGIGTLTLTGVSQTVALGTAALANGTLNAQGTLNSVVTDSRQLDYPAWSLTGQVGDFTAGASKTIEAKYLGWTPAVSGNASGSVAGAFIAPAPVENEGLKVIRTLATGKPNSAGTVTNASALLQLKAPANTPAGDYSATLTLTLI